jgi:predicted nucleotidyltransferase component of viral defense system
MNSLTSAQVKGRIKSIAQKKHVDARVLLRLYAMERFLERLGNSKYADHFVIKGGILVTAMVGVSLRSTMDIDTSIRNENLSAEDAQRIVNEICGIDLGDGMTFSIKSVDNIMDEMEYPGIRILMNATMEKMVIPLKIDISTGDVITPRAVVFQYPLMLEDRSIPLWSYNLETVLGEKLQTVLARGVFNTRMRDFYDIRSLYEIYKNAINAETLRQAFDATCRKRGTETLAEQADEILETIESSDEMNTLWKSYQRKYSYASDISFLDTLQSARLLISLMR